MNATSERQKLTCFTFKCATVMLLMIVVFLSLRLSRSWKNERFLDAELNKYTTNSTNMIK